MHKISSELDLIANYSSWLDKMPSWKLEIIALVNYYVQNTMLRSYTIVVIGHDREQREIGR